MWLCKLAPQSKSKLAPAESSTTPPLPNCVHHHLHPPRICILSAVLVSFLFFFFFFVLSLQLSAPYPCPHVNASTHNASTCNTSTQSKLVFSFFFLYTHLLLHANTSTGIASTRLCPPSNLYLAKTVFSKFSFPFFSLFPIPFFRVIHTCTSTHPQAYPHVHARWPPAG